MRNDCGTIWNKCEGVYAIKITMNIMKIFGRSDKEILETNLSLAKQNRELTETISKLQQIVDNIEKKKEQEKEDQRKELEKKVDYITGQNKDLEANLIQARKDLEKVNSQFSNYKKEEDLRLREITIQAEEKNNEARIEVAQHKVRSEVLEKAFENMGFTVKDMGDKFDKLLDGIVSGNKINVIKME